MNYLVKLRQTNKSLNRSWRALDPADVWFEVYDKDKVPPPKCTRASINKRLRHLKQHNKYRPLRRAVLHILHPVREAGRR